MNKPKIFLVEDSAMQAMFLRTELETLGYEVVGTAAEGEEAVKRILETKPDVLLLDLHLAGDMEGSDVALRINEAGGIPHIYLTAYSNEETFLKTTMTNPSGYILKPYASKALDFQIRLALSNEEARKQVEERGRKLQALIEQSGDAIILTDSAGKIVEWNPKAEEVFGMPRRETLGREIWDVQFDLLVKERRTKEEYEQLKRRLSAIYGSSPPSETSSLKEGSIELPDGRRRTVQVSYFRIEEKDDFLVCGIVRDITRQKEYEYDQDTLHLVLTACNTAGESRLLIREYCSLLRERLDFSGTAGYLTDERGRLDFVSCEGNLTREMLERPEVMRLLDEVRRTEISSDFDRFPGLVPLGGNFRKLLDFPRAAGLPKDACGASPGILSLAPIRSGADHLGLILFCAEYDMNEKTKRLSLLELAMEQLALTLKRFFAENALKEQNKVLSVRNLLSSKLNSSLDLDEILDHALNVMSETLDAEGGMVHLYDENTKRLALYRDIGMDKAVKARFLDLSMNDTILGPSATLGSTIIVDDLSLDTGKVPETASGQGWRSIICTPLKREEKLYGVLSFFSFKKGRFDGATLDLMNSAAKNIVMAIENSFLYLRLSLSNEELEHRVQERTNNLEVINKISQNLNYVMDYRSLFSLLFTHLWDVTRFDFAAGLFREEKGSQLFISKTCEIEEKAESYFRTRVEANVWKLAGTSKPLLSAVLLSAEGVPYDAARTVMSVGTFYEAPIYYENELIAYLVLGAERKDAFSENQLQLLNIVVNQSSVLLKRLRDLLSSEKTRLEQIVKFLPEGILLLDQEGRIVIRNPVADDLLKPLFGGSVPEILTALGGLSLDELVARDDAKATGSARIEAGGDRILSVTAVPIGEGPDAGGKVLSIKDITMDLMQESQIKLRERLAAVGQLAAGIAHDFNNILTGIIGYSEYLQLRKDISDTAKPYLRKIVEQSKRAGSLIQQILDFSRKSIAEIHSLDLVPFCKEMAKLFTRLIPENIHIDFETPDKSCMVRGDPTQIQQILTNLVVNSRDAMPEGGNINVRLESLLLGEGETPPTTGLGAGPWARISVGDTGSGIPKEVLPRVFEPFFTTKEVGKGSGLGLAQVYGLVQQHNGHIDIESTVGKGTRVDIYLPIAAGKESEVEEAAEVCLPVRSEGVILFVEDEAGVREVTSNVLKEIGFTVFAAENGREGFELFESHRDKIELVISDIVMPKMGGRELFRAIRKLNHDVPFLFITGHPFGQEDDLAELLQDSVILRKPLEFATLIKTINEILSTVKRPDGEAR